MPFPTQQHEMAPVALYRPVSDWTPEEIKEMQANLNRQLGPEYISERMAPGGRRVHYLEGWKVIKLANEIFGFNGWTSEIRNVCVDYEDSKEGGRLDLGLSVIVRVTLKDGTFHEDIGYGHIENAKARYMAYDKCKKEATTDGLKRALRNFGSVLGNCLYDSNYVKQATKVPIPTRRFDPGALQRAPDVIAAIEQQKRQEIQNQSGNTEQSINKATNSGDTGPQQSHLNSTSLDQQQTPQPMQKTRAQHSRAYTAPTTTTTRLNSKSSVNDNHVSKGYAAPSAKDEFEEMDFGSDLIEEYNEFDEYNLESDDFDFDVNGAIGETEMFPSNSEIPNPRRPNQTDDTHRQSPVSTVVNTPVGNGLLAELSRSHQNRQSVAGPAQSDKNEGPVGFMSQVSQSPNADKPVAFFSARVAEAVQNDQPLDDKALFDVTYQSPSLRKTVDHSASRPILRSALTPKANYDNPRLNSTRMVGRPPDMSSPTAMLPGGRPLLSMGGLSGSPGFKRPVSPADSLRDSAEISHSPLANGSGENDAKRAKN